LPRICSRFFSRRISECALDPEERGDQSERDLCSLGIGREGLEEVAAAVRPAVDLDEAAVIEQVIVDGVSVGDEIAAVTGEDIVERVARVLGGVLEKHVTLGSDDNPEVSGLALLRMLHEHTSRVDAEIRFLERVLSHRSDQRLQRARRASRTSSSARTRCHRASRYPRDDATVGGPASA
jgi:hypothetical protein